MAEEIVPIETVSRLLDYPGQLGHFSRLSQTKLNLPTLNVRHRYLNPNCLHGQILPEQQFPNCFSPQWGSVCIANMNLFKVKMTPYISVIRIYFSRLTKQITLM